MQQAATYCNPMQQTATNCNIKYEIMSSNIKIQKICQYCGKEFTARTTITRYCSHNCNSRAYKENLRARKINGSKQEPQQKLLEEIIRKDYLTIPETCQILSVSRWTIWRAIKQNRIEAGRIGRKPLIKRAELEKLFNNEQLIELL